MVDGWAYQRIDTRCCFSATYLPIGRGPSANERTKRSNSSFFRPFICPCGLFSLSGSFHQPISTKRGFVSRLIFNQNFKGRPTFTSVGSIYNLGNKLIAKIVDWLNIHFAYPSKASTKSFILIDLDIDSHSDFEEYGWCSRTFLQFSLAHQLCNYASLWVWK